jgi:hypothetical protein
MGHPFICAAARRLASKDTLWHTARGKQTSQRESCLSGPHQASQPGRRGRYGSARMNALTKLSARGVIHRTPKGATNQAGMCPRRTCASISAIHTSKSADTIPVARPGGCDGQWAIHDIGHHRRGKRHPNLAISYWRVGKEVGGNPPTNPGAQQGDAHSWPQGGIAFTCGASMHI